MSGPAVPVTAEDIALRGMRLRPQGIGTTAADILLGLRRQSNRVTRAQRRDAQRGDARRGTAGRLGMPSMPMRMAGFQRAIRTLIPSFVRGDAGDASSGVSTSSGGNTSSSGSSSGSSSDDSDDNQLANMMADLDF